MCETAVVSVICENRYRSEPIASAFQTAGSYEEKLFFRSVRVFCLLIHNATRTRMPQALIPPCGLFAILDTRQVALHVHVTEGLPQKADPDISDTRLLLRTWLSFAEG